jgi:hypothetical protein
MASASYRRREDGVLQIVRPNPLQRLGGPAKRAAAVLLILLAASAGVGLYLVLGIPFLLLAGSCVFAAMLWKSRQPRRPPAEVRTVARRSAT